MKKVWDLVAGLSGEFTSLSELHPTIVYLMGCMTFKQFCCTLRSLESPQDFCPFCQTEFTRRKRKVLESAGGWMLIENEFPRKDTEKMLLIVPTRHLSTTESLTGNDWIDIGALFARLSEKLRLSGGAFLMRFGDPRDHTGTIEHLHINIIKPVQEGGCSLPIAKNVAGPYGHDEDYRRLLTFVTEVEKRGGIEWLFSPEGIEETQPAQM